MASPKVATQQIQKKSSFITQMWRDEHPDKYILSMKVRHSWNNGEKTIYSYLYVLFMNTCLSSSVFGQERRNYRSRFPLEAPALLPPKSPDDCRATLVLDLDETLVHSICDANDSLSLILKPSIEETTTKVGHIPTSRPPPKQ